MNKARTLLEELNEMAMSRSLFGDRIRDKFLGGALGEFAKLKISKEIGEPDFWSDEVESLLDNIKPMLDRKQVKTTFKDRKLALKEAVFEASLFQDQITSARNELVKTYPSKFKQILKTKFKSKPLMEEMLKKHGKFILKFLGGSK